MVFLGKILSVTHEDRKIHKRTVTTEDFFDESGENQAREEILNFLANKNNGIVGPVYFKTAYLKNTGSKWILELISVEETS